MTIVARFDEIRVSRVVDGATIERHVGGDSWYATFTTVEKGQINKVKNEFLLYLQAE